MESDNRVRGWNTADALLIRWTGRFNEITRENSMEIAEITDRVISVINFFEHLFGKTFQRIFV